MAPHKLLQIVQLREMLRKWRRLAAMKARSFPMSRSSSGISLHRTRSWPMPGGASAPRLAPVPAGHLAVYVGDERERFVIKTALLTHPLFKALLQKSEEELGLHYEGGLTIPCEVSAFNLLLRIMKSTTKADMATSTGEAIGCMMMTMTMMQNEDTYENGNQFQRLVCELLQLLHSIDMRFVRGHEAIEDDQGCAIAHHLHQLCHSVSSYRPQPIFG